MNGFKHKRASTVWVVLGLTGLLATAAQAKNVTIPAGFQGQWAYADNAQQRSKVCAGKYDSDDGVMMYVNAAKKSVEVWFYEGGYKSRWVSIQQPKPNQISGKVSRVYLEPGEPVQAAVMEHITMTLVDNGKQLQTKNVLSDPKAATFLLCSRKTQV